MIIKKKQLVLRGKKHLSCILSKNKNSGADMQDDILIAYNGNKQYKTYIKCT